MSSAEELTQLDRSYDHTTHGSCPEIQTALRGCHCPDLELVITSGISINLRTKKLETEISPHITQRCGCCFGSIED